MSGPLEVDSCFNKPEYTDLKEKSKLNVCYSQGYRIHSSTILEFILGGVIIWNSEEDSFGRMGVAKVD